MRYAFLIPFRTDNGRREQLFNWTADRIKFFFPDSNIYVGSGPAGEFNRSAAINEAFSKIRGEEFVIINDSDTIWNMPTVISGVNALRSSRFVIPYTRYNVLSEHATETIISGPLYVQLHSSLECSQVIHVNTEVWNAPPVSGTLMMRSRDFNLLGGFDERFVGWGEEDVAFVCKAAKNLGRPHRFDGDVYHLYHPRGLDFNQPHYAENNRLLRREYL